MICKKVENMVNIIAVLTSFGAIILSSLGTPAFSQEVDLIEINSGNSTLDNNLPKFYDCIDEAIDSSKDTQKDPYFENEPTKNEVITCYDNIFLIQLE
ncbi:MAG: hypothetical protein H0X03_01655 [Nitrosopumilus sp.]|nr:hypothetical protein [Nitrosopumilus sp.]